MNQIGRSYPSDLTNQQWDVIKDLIPPARRGGRKRTADVRKVLDAVFYLNRTGCGWRYLPENFPPWRTVYEYFSKWRSTRVLEVICEELSKIARKQSGKEEIPSVLIIDSQSAKAQFGESRGYDGFKKVRGRKRHIIVDTLGIVHGIRISPANVGDVNEGIELYADGGYRHKFADAMVETFPDETHHHSRKHDPCRKHETKCKRCKTREGAANQLKTDSLDRRKNICVVQSLSKIIARFRANHRQL